MPGAQYSCRPGEEGGLWLRTVFSLSSEKCPLTWAGGGVVVSSLPRRKATFGKEDSVDYDRGCLQLRLQCNKSFLWVCTGECWKGLTGRLWPGCGGLEGFAKAFGLDHVLHAGGNLWGFWLVEEYPN